MPLMKRGEVWWVGFDPAMGGEVRKPRPAVIISNDSAIRALNLLQVVPLSSKTDKIYPCETVVTAGGRRSKAMADQIATVAKERLPKELGRLTPEELTDVDRVIRLQLGLS